MTTAMIEEYSAIDAGLAILRNKYAGRAWDVSTGALMQEARKARADVRDRRVALEAIRKEIKAPALERCRAIDAEAKRITAALEEIESPIDSAIRAEEARREAERQAKARAEAERIAQALAEVDAIRDPARRLVGRPSSEIDAAGRALHALSVARVDEFGAAAETAKQETLDALRGMLAAAREAEAEAARMARERAELARLKAEQAALEAERRKAQAAEDASREEAARVARAKIEAEEARLRAEDVKIRKRERILAAGLLAERERVKDEQAVTARGAYSGRTEALALLEAFVRRFGDDEEFRGVTDAIKMYFAHLDPMP
jgi:hypothetical protein